MIDLSKNPVLQSLYDLAESIDELDSTPETIALAEETRSILKRVDEIVTLYDQRTGPSMYPRILYHAAAKKFDEIKPGIKITGEKVEWDFGESNEFLYAVDDKEAAISQGFASSIEKKFFLHRFQVNDERIVMTFDKDHIVPTLDDLNKLKIFVYTISVMPNQGWVKNNNSHNQMEGEYKTRDTIKKHYLKVEEVNTEAWLRTKKVTIKESE